MNLGNKLLVSTVMLAQNVLDSLQSTGRQCNTALLEEKPMLSGPGSCSAGFASDCLFVGRNCEKK